MTPTVSLLRMPDQVLLVATHHRPWTERVAETLVEVDGDDVEVALLHVFSEEERNETVVNLDIEGEPDLDQLARRKDDVKAGIDVLEAAGVPYTVHGLEHENQAEAVLAMADDLAIDRIYIYSRRRSPAGKAIFGSALQDVIIGASVPVVVTPSET